LRTTASLDSFLSSQSSSSLSLTPPPFSVDPRERESEWTACQRLRRDTTTRPLSNSPVTQTISKVLARAARRDRLRLKAKQETLQQEVLVARRMILERNKTGEIIDESVLLKELGISGCLACCTPCQRERRASKNLTLSWRGCGEILTKTCGTALWR
jgi:hypothetical protein